MVCVFAKLGGMVLVAIVVLAPETATATVSVATERVLALRDGRVLTAQREITRKRFIAHCTARMTAPISALLSTQATD